MENNILGTLREDERDKGVFHGSIAHGDRHIDLLVNPDGGPLPDCLALARSVVSDLSNIDSKARHAAVRDLLKLYNENWREGVEADGEGRIVSVSNPEITEQQFMSTIMLTSVNIAGDSHVSVAYDDGGLFCGHAIFVISFDGVAFSDPDVSIVG
jgi:hypothetical protein